MVAGRLKFIIGGLAVAVAIVLLIISASRGSVQYFMTVNELLAKGRSVEGKNVRISGAVVGESIHYDPVNLVLTFEIAHVPGNIAEIEAGGGLIKILHDAVEDPLRSRMLISYAGVKPDLLQNEAQAIATGHLGEDGVFYADELLLKCPTKYEEALPDQVIRNK